MSGATELLAFPEVDPRMRRLRLVLNLLTEQLGREPTREEMLDHMTRRDMVMDMGVQRALAEAGLI